MRLTRPPAHRAAGLRAVRPKLGAFEAVPRHDVHRGPAARCQCRRERVSGAPSGGTVTVGGRSAMFCPCRRQGDREGGTLGRTRGLLKLGETSMRQHPF